MRVKSSLIAKHILGPLHCIVIALGHCRHLFDKYLMGLRVAYERLDVVSVVRIGRDPLSAIVRSGQIGGRSRGNG